ncbi:uncharacterized protein LOC124640421 [Helicoverpa zea]|uniref:uncharacterized protein LOC124640421 n=1 Tax=Helicoverpa zea TaxID=7113 RepID=UPI001F5A77D5|nr:uncharacterized protein LOC124640421 [Helicoverpa zea]
MTCCSIKVCRNYKGRLKSPKDITYHRIPNDPIIKHRWIDRIRKSREDETWTPRKSAVVCSDHFRSKDMGTVDKKGRRRLSKEAVPSKKLFLSSVQSSESENSDDIENDNENPETGKKSNANEAEPSSEHSDVGFSFVLVEDQVPYNDQYDAIIKDEIVEVQIKTDINDMDQVPNNDQSDAIINDKIDEVQNKTRSDDEKSFSDIDSVFDTPEEHKLRRHLRRKIALEKKHILKIKSLRQKNERLEKKLASYKKIIETLKRERNTKTE